VAHPRPNSEGVGSTGASVAGEFATGRIAVARMMIGQPQGTTSRIVRCVSPLANRAGVLANAPMPCAGAASCARQTTPAGLSRMRGMATWGRRRCTRATSSDERNPLRGLCGTGLVRVGNAAVTSGATGTRSRLVIANRVSTRQCRALPRRGSLRASLEVGFWMGCMADSLPGCRPVLGCVVTMFRPYVIFF
jgi:hypothetical protein